MRGGMELNVGTVVPADVLIMTIGLRDHHNCSAAIQATLATQTHRWPPAELVVVGCAIADICPPMDST